MAFKINNDTYSPNPNFDSISVSGSYHTISYIKYKKINYDNFKNTTGTTDIHMHMYNNSGSYAAGSSSYARTKHTVQVNWTSNQNILSSSYEALKSQISIYSGSQHVIDI
tara:strand:- start:727 stop:1056 length:330 start_codon:yes stop_codon:yes gene_type:complete